MGASVRIHSRAGASGGHRMADRWKQTAEAERKLEQKAAKNLLKL